MRSHLTLPGFNGRYRIYTTGKGPGLKGENHPMSKLTYNQRKEIESLYRTGKYTMRKLSIRYNVSRVTIGNCVKLFKQR